MDPDINVTLLDVSDSPHFQSNTTVCISITSALGGITSHITPGVKSIFAPFKNATTFHIMNWHSSGLEKGSAADTDRLINEVIFADDFDREDLHSFSIVQEN